MNRMALFCSLLVVGLTAAALIEHRRAPEPSSIDSPPVVAAVLPAGAGAHTAPTGPQASAEVPVARVDRTALRAQLTREIVKPIQASFLERVNFSRVRMPARELFLELREETEERAPREDAQEFVFFAIEQEGGRFRERGKRSTLARGRVHATTGRVELALVRRGTEGVEPAWKPASDVMRVLGVKTLTAR